MKEEIISELKYAIDGKIEENNKMISEKIEENLKIRSSFFGASHGDLSKSENQRQFIEGLDEIMRSSIHNRKSRHTEYINQNDKRKVDLNNVEIIQRRDFDQSNTRRLDNSEESKTKEEEDDKEDIFYDCE